MTTSRPRSPSFANWTVPRRELEDLDDWRRVADLLLTKKGELRKRVDAHPLKARCEQLLASLRAKKLWSNAWRDFAICPRRNSPNRNGKRCRRPFPSSRSPSRNCSWCFASAAAWISRSWPFAHPHALGQVDAPEDLALALGHRIQHFLVDEFQDTSYTQFELIEKLTAGWEPGDGRTLFLVGDPMQSIYRFRQADVSLFLKARLEGIGAIRLEPLTLSVNFRSRPGIVEWVNRTFESILPARDDLESGAVAYSPSVPGAAARTP